MSRHLSGLLLGVVLGGLGLPLPVVAAPDQSCAQAGAVDAGAPWPGTMLAIESTWPFSRGGGITVAVLSTGVDASQPQLKGRVDPGFDAVADRGTADDDCTGTGTQVAGVIAAHRAGGNEVVGAAPGTRIQPVRVVPDNPSDTASAEPEPLARGIAWSAGHGADVIVVATPVYRETEGLRTAVDDALGRGIVVVAAAGSLDADGLPLPAALPGVLGVGAVGPDGQLWEKSPAGAFVDLVAPGVAVPTLQRGTGAVQVDGTGVAAGFVGAVAAQVQAKRGHLPSPEIDRIIVSTTSPAPIGKGYGGYGAGVVNPYSALTDQIAPARARPLSKVAAATPPETGTEGRRRGLALGGAGLAGILVVGVLLVTAAVRRRSWRPGLPEPLPVVEEPIEAGPPVMLLDDQDAARLS